MGVCTALRSRLRPYTLREFLLSAWPGLHLTSLPKSHSFSHISPLPKFRHCPQASPFCRSSFWAPGVSDLECGVLKAEGWVQPKPNAICSATPGEGEGCPHSHLSS